MDPKTKTDLAKAEYLQLQSFIDAFDSRAFTIKAWSVTFSLAAVAGAFASHAAPVFLVAALSAILFWVVETHWNGIKSSYYGRIVTLESFFRGEDDSLVPMQILNNWVPRFRGMKRGGFFFAMWKLHIQLPHLPIVLISSALFWASYMKWITV